MSIRTSTWALILNANNQMLLLRRSKKVNNGGQWNMPGGGIEAGERPNFANLREVFEEAGIKRDRLIQIDKLKVTQRLDTNDTRIYYVFVYRCTPYTRIKLNQESSAYKWLDLKNTHLLKVAKTHRATFHILKSSAMKLRIRNLLKVSDDLAVEE